MTKCTFCSYGSTGSRLWLPYVPSNNMCLNESHSKVSLLLLTCTVDLLYLHAHICGCCCCCYYYMQTAYMYWTDLENVLFSLLCHAYKKGTLGRILLLLLCTWRIKKTEKGMLGFVIMRYLMHDWVWDIAPSLMVITIVMGFSWAVLNCMNNLMPLVAFINSFFPLYFSTVTGRLCYDYTTSRWLHFSCSHRDRVQSSGFRKCTLFLPHFTLWCFSLKWQW